MKKLFFVLAIAGAFAACNNQSASTEPAADTTAVAAPVTEAPAADTTAAAAPAADSTQK